MNRFSAIIIQRQAGAVLVISLIILVLLSIIGVSAALNTSLEERMAGNMRDRNLAFQAAESALKEAENSLSLAPTTPTMTRAGVGGYYSIKTPLNVLSPITVTADNFWTDNPVITYNSGTLKGVAQPPQYVIQDTGPFTPCAQMPCPPGPHLYRITVRATGGTNNSIVILQSLIKH